MAVACWSRARPTTRAAADALERRGDLIAAFAPHVTWTSAATHAVLPLLATEHRRAAAAAHRRRARTASASATGKAACGCPSARTRTWLDDLLEEAGARLTCVDWTDVLGPGTHAPVRSKAGVLLVPLDREGIDLVWARDGYPSAAAYRDSHRLTARTPSPVGGRRLALRRRTRGRAGRVATPRTSSRGSPTAPGLSVIALDTELLGTHWHEGVDWLRAVHPRVRAPRAAARAAARGRRRRGRAGGRRRRRAGATGATCGPGATRRPAAWRGCSGRPSCGH